MYLDGFVIPLPNDKKEAYRAMATLGCKVWMKHGALAYREMLLDPTDKPMDGIATFPSIAGAGEGETVVFAYILYRDRAHRDEVNAKVMADPTFTDMPKEMPFDMARMAYGGFTALVEHGKGE